MCVGAEDKARVGVGACVARGVCTPWVRNGSPHGGCMRMAAAHAAGGSPCLPMRLAGRELYPVRIPCARSAAILGARFSLKLRKSPHPADDWCIKLENIFSQTLDKSISVCNNKHIEAEDERDGTMNTNTKQYRSEAPVTVTVTASIHESKRYFAKVLAGRDDYEIGHGPTARAAYKVAQSNYRGGLRHGWLVPAIIDENGKAH